jgi:hypothetical protein
VKLGFVPVDGADELDFFERQVALFDALLEGRLVLFSAPVESSVEPSAAVVAGAAVSQDSPIAAPSAFGSAVVVWFSRPAVLAALPVCLGGLIGKSLVQRLDQVILSHASPSTECACCGVSDENIGRKGLLD